MGASTLGSTISAAVGEETAAVGLTAATSACTESEAAAFAIKVSVTMTAAAEGTASIAVGRESAEGAASTAVRDGGAESI